MSYDQIKRLLVLQVYPGGHLLNPGVRHYIPPQRGGVLPQECGHGLVFLVYGLFEGGFD